MKKLIALVLSTVLVFSLTACSEGTQDNSSSSAPSRLTVSKGASVKVADYVANGEIYGCEFKIGTSVQSIKDAYHYGDESYWGNGETEADPSDVKYNIDATPLEIYGEDPIRLVTGDAKYYYHPANESDGISFIAFFGDAFGLRVGVSEPDDVRAAVSEKVVFDNFAEPESLFFFFGEPSDIYQLEYLMGDYKLAFFFENGKLAATTLNYVPVWEGSQQQ